MDILDEFDINIIKELEKMVDGILCNCCDIKISNTMENVNAWWSKESLQE
jgi:hypothetical protein